MGSGTGTGGHGASGDVTGSQYDDLDDEDLLSAWGPLRGHAAQGRPAAAMTPPPSSVSADPAAGSGTGGHRPDQDDADPCE